MTNCGTSGHQQEWTGEPITTNDLKVTNICERLMCKENHEWYDTGILGIMK